MLKIPGNYKEYSEAVMSNFDHEINESIAKKLKKENIYSQYAGWNFCGYVWWNRKIKKWCCEVWQYRSHVETITANTLNEIMEDVSNKYGND